MNESRGPRLKRYAKGDSFVSIKNPVPGKCMETLDQHVSRLKRYVRENQLASVMSDAKWRRLLAALDSLPYWVALRRKDLDETEGNGERWDSDYQHIFGGGWAAIEWIDLCVRDGPRPEHFSDPDFLNDMEILQGALRDHHIPFSEEHGFLRVWGYLRPGATVKWNREPGAVGNEGHRGAD